MGSVDLLKGQKTMKFKWVYKIKLDFNGNMSKFIRQDWWPRASHRKLGLTSLKLFLWLHIMIQYGLFWPL